MNVEVARAAVLALLAEREAGATICPSEAARQIASGTGAKWRDAMPLVHAAVDQLNGREKITLSWKGKRLATRSGPYRIGRADD